MKYSCPIFGEVGECCSYRNWEQCQYYVRTREKGKLLLCSAQEIQQEIQDEDEE
jgi:hypothetical protein